MPTVKQVYDAYPDNDLIPCEITEETTLQDLRAYDAIDPGSIDGLFMFLCRELCDPADPLDKPQAIDRVQSAIDDLDDTLLYLKKRL